jgi:electron transport complex protein RnfA
MRAAPVPAFLKGTPILFVASGLMSLAFLGFSGLVK